MEKEVRGSVSRKCEVSIERPPRSPRSDQWVEEATTVEAPLWIYCTLALSMLYRTSWRGEKKYPRLRQRMSNQMNRYRGGGGRSPSFALRSAPFVRLIRREFLE